MKRKDLEKARNKLAEELNNQLEKERKELLDLNIELSMGKLKNTQAIKMKKKDIAQLLTLIKEKQNA